MTLIEWWLQDFWHTAEDALQGFAAYVQGWLSWHPFGARSYMSQGNYNVHGNLLRIGSFQGSLFTCYCWSEYNAQSCEAAP